jgi:hypothetical protein
MRRTPISRSKKKSKKSKSELQTLKEKLWEECKRITKARYGDTCYTCYAQGLVGKNWQTGHFIPSSVCSVELRYDLENLRPQCFRCNINLSGNWVEFERHLKNEKGPDAPEELKKRNQQTKLQQYDVLWYLQKLDEYKAL